MPDETPDVQPKVSDPIVRKASDKTDAERRAEKLAKTSKPRTDSPAKVTVRLGGLVLLFAGLTLVACPAGKPGKAPESADKAAKDSPATEGPPDEKAAPEGKEKAAK